MQLGRAIVPVLCEQSWAADGWLGIVTAGALYTPIIDHDDIEENIDKLVMQIHLAARSAADPSTLVNVDTEDLDLDRDELHRLRQKMCGGDAGGMQEANTASLANLPAEVPELPTFMMVTPDMEMAKELLMKPAEASQTVVIIGCGGVGKTMYCAYLARQPEVLRNFSKVVWLTIGQETSVDQLLHLAYLQLEHQELPSGLTADLTREYVKQAMSRKTILLILDDVWTDRPSQS